MFPIVYLRIHQVIVTCLEVTVWHHFDKLILIRMSELCEFSYFDFNDIGLGIEFSIELMN